VHVPTWLSPYLAKFVNFRLPCQMFPKHVTLYRLANVTISWTLKTARKILLHLCDGQKWHKKTPKNGTFASKLTNGKKCVPDSPCTRELLDNFPLAYAEWSKKVKNKYIQHKFMLISFQSIRCFHYFLQYIDVRGQYKYFTLTVICCSRRLFPYFPPETVTFDL
jgi:hypothetical protein